MVDKTLIIAAVGFMCVVFLMMAAAGGYYYYKKKGTSSSKKPTSSSKKPSSFNYKPFTSSYEKFVKEALKSTETVMSNLFPNLQKGFLEYKVNMTDGTKWAMQEQSVQVLINEYKRINADKTTTDEYQKVIQYETEFDKLKTTRNAALVSAQCPAGPYPANPAGPNAPSQCATLYGAPGSAINDAGCKADPKCKLVKDTFMAVKQCMACDNPKLTTAGLYTIL